MELTSESVLALAPDASSVKAAQALLKPGQWPTLGFNENAVWGECKGSGSKPYQVEADLSGPVFKCTCPSRKFPCKHSLALLLLRVVKEHIGRPPKGDAQCLLRLIHRDRDYHMGSSFSLRLGHS